ncbi:MAG: hypothetical protein PUB21_07840 [Bacteroidales bacterium]|nr:hypothetical protein [Bacteroidales bacterium]
MNIYDLTLKSDPNVLIYPDGEQCFEISYIAIAESEEQVKSLAKEYGINIEEYTIELEKSNVTDCFGLPYEAKIEDCRIY